MKIAKMIKAIVLTTTLGLGSAYAASAEETSDLFGFQDNVGPALVNTMGDSMLEAFARNPSLGLEIGCWAAVNYAAAVKQISPSKYFHGLAKCLNQQTPDFLMGD